MNYGSRGAGTRYPKEFVTCPLCSAGLEILLEMLVRDILRRDWVAGQQECETPHAWIISRMCSDGTDPSGITSALSNRLVEMVAQRIGHDGMADLEARLARVRDLKHNHVGEFPLRGVFQC